MKRVLLWMSASGGRFVAVLAVVALLVVAAIGWSTMRLAASFGAKPTTVQASDAPTPPTQADACTSAVSAWAAVVSDRAVADEQWMRNMIGATTMNVAPYVPSLPREQMPTGDATVTSAAVTDPGRCAATAAWSDGSVWNVVAKEHAGGWLVDSWSDTVGSES